MTAHVYEAPAETAATPEVRPTSLMGVELDVVVPSPSSPWSLCPQHLAAPPAVTAHVWNPPVEIWAAVSPEAGGAATTEKRKEAAPSTNALATC